jgi:hypothetical protein
MCMLCESGSAQCLYFPTELNVATHNVLRNLDALGGQ